MVFYLEIIRTQLCSFTSVAILSANEDGAQRADTWAQYGDVVSIAGDSTLCLRFNIRVFRLLTAVLYLFDVNDSDDDRELLHYLDKS